MKFLNLAAAVILAVALGSLLRPQPAPPDDPWFQQAVIRSPRPVLVKFGADWCPPCRVVEKLLDQTEGDLRGRVKVVRIDIDERPELARHYGVSAIPRLMLFQQGQILSTQGGFGDADALRNWVDHTVGK